MSLVGFKARNHPQQPERDDVNDRRTPDDLFVPLHAQHRFTLDAAASAENAKVANYCTRADSGLDRSWGGASRLVQPAVFRPDAVGRESVAGDDRGGLRRGGHALAGESHRTALVG